MSTSWVPRGALALLGIAILVLVVVAVAIPSWFGTAADSRPADRAFVKTLEDIGTTNGIRLSDDTTSHTFAVPVPIDSRLTDPVLTLRGRTEVTRSGRIFLRAHVNGESVLVKELSRGERDLEVDVDLPRSAVEGGVVKVQVRTSGNPEQRRCNLTTKPDVLVVLDPDSTGIRGELDERTHTLRDAVADLDHKVVVVLAPSAKGQQWFETAARLSSFLTQQGHEVSYSEDLPEDDDPGTPVLVGPEDGLGELGWQARGENGAVRVGDAGDRTLVGVVEPDAVVVPTFLSTAEMTTADASSTAPKVREVERPRGDRVTLEALGADTSVRQIVDRRSWRVPYSLADLPGGEVPTSVRLRMLVPPTTGGARWLVEVRLNDELVDTLLLPPGGRQTVVAAIPAGRELVRNELVVTLIRDRDRDLGGCDVRQAPYKVQLLPDSEVVLTGDGAGFTAVPGQFAAGFDVLLRPSSLEDPTRALDALVPTLAEFEAWQQKATYRWGDGPGDRPFLLLGEPPAGTATPVTIRDGRIEADGLDISTFADGLVVQCVTAGETPGLAVTPVGEPGSGVPPYGREAARLVTGGDGGFVVTESGLVGVSLPRVAAQG